MSRSAVCLHRGRLPLLPQWTLGTGHSSPPLTRSSAHLCLHGNTTVFAPRHPLVRASFRHLPFSRWWDRGTAVRPCCPLPHQPSLTGCVLPGRASGLAPGGGAPVTLFLSRSYGLSPPSPVHGEEGQAPACHMCPASARPSGFPQACCPPLPERALCHCLWKSRAQLVVLTGSVSVLQLYVTLWHLGTLEGVCGVPTSGSHVLDPLSISQLLVQPLFPNWLSS